MTELNDLRERVEEAGAEVRARLGEYAPEVGLILGSGLSAGHFGIRSKTEISVESIPHLPVPSVVGHNPVWTVGKIGTPFGTDVLIAGGRVHRYEGLPLAEVTLGVRIMAAAGCTSLIVTNAAGGIREDLVPGKLMRIRDHLNLLGDSPLVGVAGGEGIGERFVDLTEAYDREWGEQARQVAEEEGIELAEGVYAACLGPQYETPAEIDMLERLGADAVGMSTVPEVIVARQCGLRVLAFSLITNRAAGRSETTLSHEEVLRTASNSEGSLVHLVGKLVKPTL